jgi:CheY-like chemotaxis protein
MGIRDQILCVDDDAGVRFFVQSAMIYHGYNVILATHGLEGLQRFMHAAGRIKDVVTDHSMPYLGGVGFAESLRQMGFKGRIVVISGELSAAVQKQYAGLEIFAFVSKPLSIGKLAQLLSDNSDRN